MYCQRCGTTLAPGARFCNACGTPVTAPPPAPISLARPTIVTALALLQFVGGAVFLLSAILLFFASRSQSTERQLLLVFGVFCLVMALLSLITGIGLWKMREWGRLLQIVSACLGLLGVPLGTIISLLILIYFTRPHVKLLFAGKSLDQLTPEETAVLSAAGGNTADRTAGVLVAVFAVLVIVAIVGILAAIAIPNLLTAMQRSRQVRTIADMRVTAQSVEQYRQANSKLPDSIAAKKDAWGNDLRYASDGTNYWIVSAGKDGRFEEQDVTQYQAGTTTNFDDDLVMENGELRRGPRALGVRP